MDCRSVHPAFELFECADKYAEEYIGIAVPLERLQVDVSNRAAVDSQVRAALCNRLDLPEPRRPNTMWWRLLIARCKVPGAGSTKCLTPCSVDRAASSTMVTNSATSFVSSFPVMDRGP